MLLIMLMTLKIIFFRITVNETILIKNKQMTYGLIQSISTRVHLNYSNIPNGNIYFLLFPVTVIN